jgi:hypothetical protein
MGEFYAALPLGSGGNQEKNKNTDAVVTDKGRYHSLMAAGSGSPWTNVVIVLNLDYM